MNPHAKVTVDRQQPFLFRLTHLVGSRKDLVPSRLDYAVAHLNVAEPGTELRIELHNSAKPPLRRPELLPRFGSPAMGYEVPTQLAGSTEMVAQTPGASPIVPMSAIFWNSPR